MGNSQTKEARDHGPPSYSRPGAQTNISGASSSRNEHGTDQLSSGRQALPSSSASGRLGSRPDLSFLGIGNNSERDVSSLEARRETKQEREARKLEKERTARLKERERSMKEEHVDGGYLVTQGVYVGTEDYNKAVVRQLMVGSSLPQAAPLRIDQICRSNGDWPHSGEALMTFRSRGQNISSRPLPGECLSHLRMWSLLSLNIKHIQNRPQTF